MYGIWKKWRLLRCEMWNLALAKSILTTGNSDSLCLRCGLVYCPIRATGKTAIAVEHHILGIGSTNFLTTEEYACLAGRVMIRPG
jgi:hypothetical protein